MSNAYQKKESAKKGSINTFVVNTNKKALFDFEIIKNYEAGIELLGHEVKSIRSKSVNLKGSYISVRQGIPYVIGMNISPYKFASFIDKIDPKRERKLFLHRKDIIFLESKIKEKGFSVIPTEILFRGNLIKLKISLAKGKKKYEKKRILKEKSLEKNARIELSGRYK